MKVSVRSFHTLLTAVAVVASAAPAFASSPLGIYARVNSVVYEPAKANATRIQIHGVFALHKGGSGFNYSDPQAGYMYFTCPSGKEIDCRDQWDDIEARIGTSSCAGFGQEYAAFGTVRVKGVTPQNPDTFELGMGVVSGNSAGGTCQKLFAYQAPDGGSPIDDGGVVVVPDSGSPDANAGSPDANVGSPTADASTSNDGTPPSPTPSGCSSSRTPTGAGSALVIAFGAIVAAGFRRRMQRGGN